jgi:glyoxylase-like metal-dependent hydrolase (beta-lactamase superfamily II)
MDAALYRKLSQERPFNFADVVAPLPLGYRRIAEGRAMVLGGRTWDVHVGHGHAPEHATFWCREAPLVLAGDQILPSISPNLSLHPTEPEADPVAEWLESCARLARLGGPQHLILPGHKLPFRGLAMRMAQLIENHHGALARTLEALDRPRTAAECFLPIFKRHIEEPVYVMALGEALAHLNRLRKAGLVSRRDGPGGVWLWQRCTAAAGAAGSG